MNKGAYAVLNITKILTIGAATAGKTCTKHYIFDKPPPGQYTSTDVFESMERHYAYYSAVVDPQDPCEWKIATLDRTLAMIKNSIISKESLMLIDNKLGFPPTASTTDTQVSAEGPDSPPTASITDTQVSAEGPDSPPPASTTDTQVSAEGSEDVRSVTWKQSHAIKQLLHAKISGEVVNVRWIHFIDGGGKSEYLELLPTLVSNATVTIYVIDLSRKPDEYCNDFFTINDRPQGPRKTSLTGKELFERFWKTICSQQDDIKCKVMFVGTHTSSPGAKGNLKEWNKLISLLWRKHRADKVIIIMATPSCIVHAIDANSRGDYEQKAAKDMRKKLTECCIEKKVAIAEFLIEEDLKSSSQARENNGILKYSECQEITKHYATENTLKKALQYFHELNEYFYFPGEQLVFTKPHILVQIISKLIKVANHCRSDSGTGAGIKLKFWKFGLISDNDLKEILNYKDLPGEESTKETATNKYYRRGVFEGKQLLTVLQNLTIAAYCADSSAYIVPCVLPPYTKDDDLNKVTREFMKENPPLLFTSTKDREGKRGSIPRGLFYGLVTHLIDNCEWKIHSENEQNYQTLIVFEIYRMYKLVLVEDFKLSCIRVHAHQRTDKQVRLKIRKDIADGVKTISKKFYGTENDSTMCQNVSFICSYIHSEENKLLHIANVKSHKTDAKMRRLVCEKDSVHVKFAEYQYGWLHEDEDPRSPGI